MAALIAVLPASVSATSNDVCGDALRWELDDEGTLIISGIGAMYNWDYYSNAPWYSSRENINSVIIDSGVTSIGDRAFNLCRNMTSITIADSVTSIGNSAFYECRSLKNVTIPNNVTCISCETFNRCFALTGVTIGNSVTSIGEGVFWKCSSLTDVYYAGSEEQWAKISISGENECLTNATIHYNYVPTADSNTISFDEKSNIIAVESKEAIPQAELLAVLYKNGKLVELKSQPISIAKGENTYSSPITDYTGSDTVKIMIWNSIEGMKPLFDYCD